MSETEKELFDALQSMVSQHCLCDHDGPYHSGYLTANAEAMRLLAKHQRFKTTWDCTDYKKGDTRNVQGAWRIMFEPKFSDHARKRFAQRFPDESIEKSFYRATINRNTKRLRRFFRDRRIDKARYIGKKKQRFYRVDTELGALFVTQGKCIVVTVMKYDELKFIESIK